MALNKEVFKTRTLTAIVFAAVVLALLFINGYTFTALVVIIILGCWYELAKLIRKIYYNKGIAHSPIFTILLLSYLYVLTPMFCFWDMGFDQSYSHTRSVNFLDYDVVWPAAVLFSIWINDTMAYVVGSLIGKTPFSKISPKKTWEGTLGGMLLCVIVISLLAYFLPETREIGWYNFAIIAIICAVFGTLGDLFESKIKRLANVKDSGAVMPGHGGFLDRFDSLLFAAPISWLYLYLFYFK